SRRAARVGICGVFDLLDASVRILAIHHRTVGVGGPQSVFWIVTLNIVRRLIDVGWSVRTAMLVVQAIAQGVVDVIRRVVDRIIIDGLILTGIVDRVVVIGIIDGLVARRVTDWSAVRQWVADGGVVIAASSSHGKVGQLFDRGAFRVRHVVLRHGSVGRTLATTI